VTEVIGTIDYGERGQVRLVEDGAALARAAAEAFIASAGQATAEGRPAQIVLSGGSTPKQMAQLLAASPYRDQVQWDQVELWWGDERWVPLDSPESNAGEAMRWLIEHVPTLADQVHPFDTIHVTPEVSAARYEEEIKARVPAVNDLPAFDLILLGMGDDGHTASLFPGTSAIHERRHLVVGHHVAKLDTIRMTLVPRLINNAREVVFLVSGAGKAERLADVLDGPDRPDELPAQVVRPAGGPVWLVDRAAAGALARRPR
jgi:6-phosphogluconolactonase